MICKPRDDLPGLFLPDLITVSHLLVPQLPYSARLTHMAAKEKPSPESTQPDFETSIHGFP